MARSPEGHTWDGFTPEQGKLLDFLDHLGNNGWARNSQSEALMPKVLKDFADAGVRLEQVKTAMASIGYDRNDLHQLDRWESKRTTGRFGK
ncbi:hypothetical protein Q0Z83_085030 [Actinoplanes sichuanensis]|jgi:hypothetical protein|uniref:Uncharacterized protein n=1 Tax=Actinoplanes sichuanensis TaxID=512349 RepID=A0ABW4AUK8_9ACTN|nr:hypothetical protein [Actinoplanes sichuanensis]BEL10312.1 hypothetical protein Q0Z83_085030 [Actinoplanes sichuanensis]